MNRSKVFFWLGAFLVGTSGFPLLFMAREVLTGLAVGARYRFKPVYDNQSAMIGGHRVALEDDQPESADPSGRVRGSVRIVIDGRVYATADRVEIRPSFRDANRYHGFMALVRFDDVARDESHVAVVANVGVDPGVARVPQGGYNFDYLRFRLIILSADGGVRDETFFRKDRGSPPIRAALASWVSPSPMGFHSDLMMGWPNLLYPIAFPWTSGVLGALCLVATVKSRRRKAG